MDASEHIWCCVHQESGAQGINDCGEIKAEAQSMRKVWAALLSQYSARDLRVKLAASDVDHDWKLSRDEFATFLLQCGVKMGSDAAQIVFAILDFAGAGFVLREEVVQKVPLSAVSHAVPDLEVKYDDRLRRQVGGVIVWFVALSSGVAAFVAMAATARSCSRSGAQRRGEASPMAIVPSEGGLRELRMVCPASKWRRTTARRLAHYEALRDTLEPLDASGAE